MRPAPYPEFDDTAVCRQRDIDPERFFPRNGHNVEETKRLCTGFDYGAMVRPPCPFLDECLAYGLTHQVAGIWGGLSEGERRDVRRRRKIRAVPMDPLRARPRPSSAELARRMLAQGMRQADIARALGVSRQAVSAALRDAS